MENKHELPVIVSGIAFKNPFVVASGPTTHTLQQLVEIEKAGWAGAIIKLSIDPTPYINGLPRFKYFDDKGLLLMTTDKRLTFDEGLQLINNAKKLVPDLKLFTNITYAGDEDILQGWVNMARLSKEAGADGVELNMCCPNMSFNVETTSGNADKLKKLTGASMGKDEAMVSAIVGAIKAEVEIPLFVKITAEGGNIGRISLAAHIAGADCVVGPGARLSLPCINIEEPSKSYYHLIENVSMGSASGNWCMPLSMRDVYEMRKTAGKEMRIMATGGIRNATDTIQMAMAGADIVGICSETMIRGYNFVRPMISELKTWMNNHGYKEFSDLRDRVIEPMRNASTVILHTGYAHIKNNSQAAPCTAVCPYDIKIQEVLKSVSKGDWSEAYNLAAGSEECSNCEAPCEKACLKGRLGRSLHIQSLMIYIQNRAMKDGMIIPKKTVKEKNDKIIVPAIDVIKNRTVWGGEARFSKPRNDEEAMAEATACLKCACGIGCGVCMELCCEGAISANTKGEYTIAPEKCTACGMCFNLCPNKNIEMIDTGVYER